MQNPHSPVSDVRVEALNLLAHFRHLLRNDETNEAIKKDLAVTSRDFIELRQAFGITKRY